VNPPCRRRRRDLVYREPALSRPRRMSRLESFPDTSHAMRRCWHRRTSAGAFGRCSLRALALRVPAASPRHPSFSAAQAAGVCFAESTEDKTFSIAIVLFKAGANTILCFFRHWFQSVVLVTRKSFQHDSGLCTLSLSGFWLRPRLRVVGSCIRSVVAILPVGSITPVGIRNFYIPGNPGSPDWPSALRLFASSGFGSVNSSVARFVFPAVGRASAIVGISLSIALRFLSATSLHSEYHRELTDARVATFLLTRFCNLIFSSFRFPTCFVADSHFKSLCSKHLAVRLFFNSLRSIGSGCFMPFDSFMHSGFQIGFC
jgi:hypothetical protein